MRTLSRLCSSAALLLTAAFLFAQASLPTTAFQTLRKVQETNGYVRAMVAGDSIPGGNALDMGLRLPIAVSLKAHGLDPSFVGDISDNAATARWFYNTFGNVTRHQAVGGITTQTFINGNGSTLTSLATALAAWKPDVLFLCVGTNDTSPGNLDEYKTILAVCKAYRQDMPVVWYSPFDSNSTTVEYYNVDTGRAATKENIRAACLAATNSYVFYVDSAQALGQWTWYPLAGLGYVPASTDTGAETVTFTSDKWFDGTEVVPSATGGNLTAGTTYYVHRNSAAVYTLHTTRAEAMAGTPDINLTASITATLTPNTVQAANNNANGVFADGTHLRHPSPLLVAGAGTAQLFGYTVAEELALATTFEPYAPVDWTDSGQDIAASATAVIVPGGSTKKVATSLVCYNAHATDTSTVTLLKTRTSQDGSTVAIETGCLTFKVPAGATVGYTWTFQRDPGMRTGPVAHYNEGFKVAVTGGGSVNVRMTGKSTVY